MKDIKYYLQFIALMFCFLLSACNDDDDSKAPVFPELQKIECKVGDEKVLAFEAIDNWILTSSSLWCYFEQDGEKTYSCSGTPGAQSVTIHISDDASELLKSYKAEISLMMSGTQQVIAEISRPVVGYEMRIFNEDKSVMYTEENPFVIDFDEKSNMLLTSNGDWVLAEKPEWLNIKMEDGSEAVSGFAGNYVLATPSVAKLSKKDAKNASLKFESRDGKTTEIVLKYEGIPADRIITSIEEKIKVSADGDNYTVGDDNYDADGVPVTVIARNDEYRLVSVEYTMEHDPLTWEPEFTYNIIGESASQWLWTSDDRKGNVKIAASANPGDKRCAYVLAFPNSIYAEIKDQLFERVLLVSGVSNEFKENIIVDLEQTENSSASEGFILKDGNYEPLTDIDLISYTEQVGKEAAMEKYGTTNVWIASLPLGHSFNPLIVAPKGMTMNNYIAGVEFLNNSKWDGIEIGEAFMDVPIYGIDENTNGEKDMEISIINSASGMTYAVLIISKRYSD